MATALQVLQATHTGPTGTTGSWADLLTIAGGSFTANHRYWVIAYYQTIGTTGQWPETVVQFNGSDLPCTDCMGSRVNDGSTPYLSHTVMDMVTVPVGGTVAGLTFRCRTYPGYGAGQVGNVRVIAIDMDMNNADFPQQSADGWLWGADDTAQAIDTTPRDFNSITFTPDGTSDYLILGAGRMTGPGLGTVGQGGICVDGDANTVLAEYLTPTYWNQNLPFFSSYVYRPSAVKQVITYRAWVGSSTGTLLNSRLIVLRLKTFTKSASTFVNPTVAAVSTWQVGASVTPSPAATAGDKFLVFSSIKASPPWLNRSNQMQMRTMRDATQIDYSTLGQIGVNLNDFFGPHTFNVDTATGANNYSLEFSRAGTTNDPPSFQWATLAAFKAEVAYTAPSTATSIVPVFQAINNSTVTLTPSSTVYATIPDYKFVAGHRYLILSYCELLSTSQTIGVTGLSYNGSSLAHTDSVLIRGENTKFSPVHAMTRITGGTGLGVGLQFVANYSNISGAQLRNIRIQAIDLDVNNTNFPQQSINGWAWYEDPAARSLTGTWASQLSTTFTPDGVSDYMVLACGGITGVASGYQYARIAVDSHEEGTSYHYAASSTYKHQHLCFSLLKKPSAVSTSVSFDAFSGTGTGTLQATRMLILRLSTFVRRNARASRHVGNSGDSTTDVFPIAAPNTPTTANESYLVFSQLHGYSWGASANSFDKAVLRDSTTIDTRTVGSFNNLSDFVGPTHMILSKATGANAWGMTCKRNENSTYPLDFYDALFVVLSAEVSYTAPVAVSRLPVVETQDFPPTQNPSALTTSWAKKSTIAANKFIEGHVYWVMVTARQGAYKSEFGTNYASFMKLQYNGADLPGCANYFSCYGYYGSAIYTFMMTKITAVNGAELSLWGKALNGAGGMETIGNITMMAIDLSAAPDSFPNSNQGWLWAENLVEWSPTPGVWNDQASLTFTPDGTSDYIVFGDLEFTGTNLYANGTGYHRLLVNGSQPQVYSLSYDWGAAGSCKQHMNVLHVLSAPAAVPTTVKLNTQASIAAAYPMVTASRIMVIRKQAFKVASHTYSAAQAGGPGNSETTIISNTVANTPADTKLLAFRRMQTSNWVASMGQSYVYYLREASTGLPASRSETPPMADMHGTVNSYKHSFLVPSVISGNAGENPTYNFTGYCGGSTSGNNNDERVLLFLSDQFAGAIYEVAAGGEIVLGASSVGQSDAYAAANAGVAVGTSALVHAEDELYGEMNSGFSLAGSAPAEVLKDVWMAGEVSTLASALAEFETTAFALGTIIVAGTAEGESYRIFKLEQSLDVLSAYGPIVL